MTKTSKPLTVVLALLLAALLLSSAIAVPILWRGFYYGQIHTLDLVSQTGYTQETIREAYDQVMDYLVLDRTFGTGALGWSESGKAHFADCKALFWLDFMVLGASAIAMILTLLLWVGLLRRRPYRFWSKGPCVWAFLFLLAAVTVLGIWAAADFDGLFTAFHALCFPGKTNWLFDPAADPIILILPEAFWANAAALVAALAFGSAALLAAVESLLHRWDKPRSVYEDLQRMKKG